MRLRILAIGKRLPDWLEAGIGEYAKRLPKQYPLEVVTLRVPAATSATAQQSRMVEAEALLSRVSTDEVVVALDERGDQWTTRELAVKLTGWRDDSRNVALLIGGAEGLAQQVRDSAQHLWGLSRLTLPHGLARLVVAEQIYRGWTLMNNHPYHRG